MSQGREIFNVLTLTIKRSSSEIVLLMLTYKVQEHYSQGNKWDRWLGTCSASVIQRPLGMIVITSHVTISGHLFSVSTPSM